MVVKRSTLYGLCFLTLVGFTGIAELILQFGHDRSLIDLIGLGEALWWQLGIGLAVGWLGARGAYAMLALKWLRPIKGEYFSMLRMLNLRPREAVFLSY